MSVRRFDASGELCKPVKQANGWLKADGYVSRVGVFNYRRADGSVIREYRSPAEVFKADSLESFNLVPMTNDHPAAGLLDADNTREYQVGSVIAPRQDGNFIRAQFLITDAATIAELESGKTQLSGGYVCDVVESPGVSPDGEKYDAIQTNVRGNHVAIVAAGRAGPDVRLRMDATDAVMLDSPARFMHYPTNSPISNKSDEVKMIKLKLDGVEVEVTEVVAALLDKQVKATGESLTAAKKDAEQATARADAAEAKLAKAEKELAAVAKAKADEARAALEETARGALADPDVKFDGLTDLQIKAKVAEHCNDIKLDGKTDGYIEAMFDIALKDNAKTDEEETSSVAEHTDASDPIEAAKAKYQAALKKVQPS